MGRNDIMEEKLISLLCENMMENNCECYCNHPPCSRVKHTAQNLIENGFVTRKKGQWVPVERHRGGYRSYNGFDEMGEKHTVTVNEHYTATEYKCSECGKFAWNEMFPHFCSNCGADMRKTETKH